MEQKLQKILNKKWCTEAELDFLCDKLPQKISTEVFYEGGEVGVRAYVRFYLHEVRGYCLCFLGDKESEIYSFHFYDLDMNNYASYKELKKHFYTAGGYAAADPRNDSKIAAILNQDYITDSYDYDILFDKVNYLTWEHNKTGKTCKGVIWFNEHEHCVINAAALNECTKCRMSPTNEGEIEIYDHGVHQRTIYDRIEATAPSQNDSNDFLYFDKDNDGFTECTDDMDEIFAW